MLDPAVIDLLRCPVTHQPLRLATTEEKRARNLPDAEEVLICADGSHLYRAPEGLSVLLPAKEVTVAEAG